MPCGGQMSAPCIHDLGHCRAEMRTIPSGTGGGGPDLCRRLGLRVAKPTVLVAGLTLICAEAWRPLPLYLWCCRSGGPLAIVMQAVSHHMCGTRPSIRSRPTSSGVKAVDRCFNDGMEDQDAIDQGLLYFFKAGRLWVSYGTYFRTITS